MEDFLFDFYSFFAPADLLQCLFLGNVLTSITLSVVILTFLICLLFYRNPFAFRRWFYKLSHWLLSMLFAAALCFFVAYLTCVKIECEDGFAIFFIFGIEIMVLSSLLFLVYSLLLKNLSVIARKTPF